MHMHMRMHTCHMCMSCISHVTRKGGLSEQEHIFYTQELPVCTNYPMALLQELPDL